MLSRHTQLVNLGGRSRGAVASFRRMTSYVLKEESAKTEEEDDLQMDIPCRTARQDRTWKRTQGISFAEAKVKALTPSDCIRLSIGPSSPLPNRAEARKLSSSARTMAADEASEDITDTTRQYEARPRQDSPLVEVASSEEAHSEEPHWGNLDLRRAVAGPFQDFGHQSAGQTLSEPLNAMVSKLYQELKGDRGLAHYVYLEDIGTQRPQLDLRHDMLPMLDEHSPAETKSTVTTAGTDSARRLITPWADRDDETCSRGKNPLLFSGSLGFQCSMPLAHSDLSTSKYLTESEPLYPVVEGLQFASRPADYGTNGHNVDDASATGDSADSSTPTEDMPFSTPLGYHIPKATLQRAIDAAPSAMTAYWQYTLYQGPGGEKDKVKVHYCKSKDSTERISQLFLHEEVIGFDIEWTMNATTADGVKKNVALIQIASEERIALFHIARYPNATDVDDFVAPTFKKIMESPKITKVGVSVKGDCTRLRKFMNIEARGIFELSHLYKLVKFSCGDIKKINKVLVNLAQQVKEHLQLPLWKGEVRSSDWSQDLNYQQIQYAASDSYAGFQLFHILEAKRKALDPTPPRPAHAELDLPIRLANGRTVATYNDGVAESVEDSSLDTGPDTPISIEELAHDFLNLQIEEPYAKELPGDPAVQKAAKGTTKDTSSSKPSPPSSTSKPLHPSVILANTWLTHYTNTLSPSRPVVARPCDLRAYHLWYHQNLDIQEIASRLRDPPLAISTVAGYVLGAVKLEKLPFHRKKVWGLVNEVHRSFRGGYKMMIVQRIKEEERG